MRGICTICSDLFENASVISAAPCGHVFHTECLETWTNVSQSCPICRIYVPLTNILKLQFHIDSSDASNGPALENEVQRLKAEFSVKKMQIEKKKQDNIDLVLFIADLELSTNLSQETNLQYESEIEELNVKLQSLSGIEAKANELQETNMSLSNRLQLLNNVKLIVSGTEEDASNVIRICAKSSKATSQLATYCYFLKRNYYELLKDKRFMKTQMENEVNVVKKSLDIGETELINAKFEMKNLEEQVLHLEKENASLKRKIRCANISSSISDLNGNLPSPDLSKSRFSHLNMTVSNGKRKCRMDVRSKKVGETSTSSIQSTNGQNIKQSRCMTAENSVRKTRSNHFLQRSTPITKAKYLKKK